MKRSFLTFAALLGLLSGSALADTVLVIGSETSGHSFKVKDGQILISQTGEGAMPRTILYNKEKREMTVIDHSDKTFLKLEAEKLEKIGEKVNDVINEVDERIGELGEGEQQAAFRGLLRGVLGEIDSSVAEQEKIEFTLREKKSQISKWQCEVLDRKKNGERDATFYLVSREELEISEADFATLMSLETFTNDLLVALPAGESIRRAVGPPNLYFPKGKVPVQTISYSEEGEKIANRLREISTEPFDGNDFGVPQDYNKKDIPF